MGLLRAILAVAFALGVAGSNVKYLRHGNDALYVTGNTSLPVLHSNRKLSHFIVVPEHKLLFCYINKVGCTSFNDMFRRLRSRYQPSQAKGSVWNRNTPESQNIDAEALQRMLVDPAWHKAVFYREPLERFVSAYKSKCEGADKRFGHAHCRNMFGEDYVSFDVAVNQMHKLDGLHHLASQQAGHVGDVDPHFWLQQDFCGGLADTLQYYDTVEQLERNTSHDKVSKLLAKVGVDAKSIPQFDALFPPAGDTDWQDLHHNTNSGDELRSYFPEDKPSLSSDLLHHYRRDYELFQIGMPEWLPEAEQDNAHKTLPALL